MQPFRKIKQGFAGLALADELALPQWRRRMATVIGALLVGIVALSIAWLGDQSQRLFGLFYGKYPYLTLVLSPLLLVLFVGLTRKFAPGTRGSGIPQVIAASHNPEGPAVEGMLGWRATISKPLLTLGGLLVGASVGREGPTVQVAAALMVKVHRWLKVPISAGVLIAGGAAGVSAAFNTPLAGIAFAIEELAVAYEQRVAVLAMAAVMIAGLTSQGLAGEYLYFGHVGQGLPVLTVLVAAPLAGVLGGIFGGLFSRALIELRAPGGRFFGLLGRHPVITTFVCGVLVSLAAFASEGLTWGTGYGPTKDLLMGASGAMWFGPLKFLATLATSASGIPGGIFAPSLAVGAGVGELLTPLFSPEYAGGIVLLGMAGYFTGVVRAPLTAVIILAETTGSSGTIIALFATALIADWSASLVCKDRLYHVLAGDFLPPKPPEPVQERERDAHRYD
jgi:H+/Cl- antiporter ClcA